MSTLRWTPVLFAGMLFTISGVGWSMAPDSATELEQKPVPAQAEEATAPLQRASGPLGLEEAEEELSIVEARLRISSIKALAGEDLLHVYCPVDWPDGGWVEDGYFSLVGENTGSEEQGRTLKRPDGRTGLYVWWTALPGQTQARCQSTKIGRATLTLNAVGPDGEAVRLSSATGCGHFAFGMGNKNGEVANTFELFTYPEVCTVTAYPAKEGLQPKKVAITPMEVGSSRTLTVAFDKVKPVEVAPSPGKTGADFTTKMLVVEEAFLVALEEEVEQASGVYRAELGKRIIEVKAKILRVKRLCLEKMKFEETDELLDGLLDELAEGEEDSEENRQIEEEFFQAIGLSLENSGIIDADDAAE